VVNLMCRENCCLPNHHVLLVRECLFFYEMLMFILYDEPFPKCSCLTCGELVSGSQPEQAVT
jgi:hypothetical protein